MADEQSLELKLSIPELTAIVKDVVIKKIEKIFEFNHNKIETQIAQYFNRDIFNKRDSTFDTAMDWEIEQAFRLGIDTAMKEIKLPEMIAEKAKELLLSPGFLSDLAEKKIRASLGLPKE